MPEPPTGREAPVRPAEAFQRPSIMKYRALVGVFSVLLGPPFVLGADESSWGRQIEKLVHQGQLAEATRLAETAAREPGTGASAYSWLGRISMAGARFEEAAQRFGRARELGASVVEIADPWSRALVRMGKREDACVLLGDASSVDERNANLRYLAGACYLRLDSPRDALPHLEAAHRHGLSHSAASMDLARARFGSGREDLAVDQLAEMTEQSSDPGMLLAIGQMLFRNVLYRQALAPLEKARETRPGWYEAGMYLALAHYQLEEYRNCAAILSDLALESRPAEARFLLGSALARLGEYEAARRELETGIRMAPDRADGYLNLGLFFLDRGQRGAALEVFEKVASKDPRGAKIFFNVKSRVNCRGLKPPEESRNGDARQARFFAEFGDSLLAGQQWGAALEVYLTSLSINSRLARPYGGIGLICQELGTAEAGLEFVKSGLQLHASDRELHYYLGSLYEYLSQPLRAIESYRAALRLGDPDTIPPRYWLRLGLAQLAAGEAAGAEGSFQAALDREPGFAEAHYHLGKIRFRDGQYAEAESLFERAVNLDPSLAEAYYSWGLACVRNGKSAKGRAILESHRRKAALRQAHSGGMQ